MGREKEKSGKNVWIVKWKKDAMDAFSLLKVNTYVQN